MNSRLCYLIAMILLTLFSCAEQTDSQSRGSDSALDSNTTIEESGHPQDVKNRTLFGEYTVGMKKSEANENGYTYTFYFSDPDRLDVRVKPYFNNDEELYQVVLKSSNSELVNRQNIEQLQKLYQEKYKMSGWRNISRDEMVVAKLNQVQRIMWGPNNAKDFQVFNDIHYNQYPNGAKSTQPNACFFNEPVKNSDLRSEPGYHVHAYNDITGEKWVFPVSLKLPQTISAEYVTRECSASMPVDTSVSIKMIHSFINKSHENINTLLTYDFDNGGQKVDPFLENVGDAINLDITVSDSITIIYQDAYRTSKLNLQAQDAFDQLRDVNLNDI